jgi:predicted XRE-type DNA-binding protein
VVCVAKFEDAIYVLHCFQKKTQQTSQKDLDLATKRYKICWKNSRHDYQPICSVWDAIEDTPQQAASMKARSSLMMALSEIIHERGLTQADAEQLFGVTQPRISDLVRGKLHLFSLDTLMDMAATAGLDPTVKLSKPKVARPSRRGTAGKRPMALA